MYEMVTGIPASCMVAMAPRVSLAGGLNPANPVMALPSMSFSCTTWFTSNGVLSITMFADEYAPTSQPVRVNGTQGAGALWPSAVNIPKVVSADDGDTSLTKSVQ